MKTLLLLCAIPSLSAMELVEGCLPPAHNYPVDTKFFGRSADAGSSPYPDIELHETFHRLSVKTSAHPLLYSLRSVAQIKGIHLLDAPFSLRSHFADDEEYVRSILAHIAIETDDDGHQFPLAAIEEKIAAKLAPHINEKLKEEREVSKKQHAELQRRLLAQQQETERVRIEANRRQREARLWRKRFYTLTVCGGIISLTYLLKILP